MAISKETRTKYIEILKSKEGHELAIELVTSGNLDLFLDEHKINITYKEMMAIKEEGRKAFLEGQNVEEIDFKLTYGKDSSKEKWFRSGWEEEKDKLAQSSSYNELIETNKKMSDLRKDLKDERSKNSQLESRLRFNERKFDEIILKLDYFIWFGEIRYTGKHFADNERLNPYEVAKRKKLWPYTHRDEINKLMAQIIMFRNDPYIFESPERNNSNTELEDGKKILKKRKRKKQPFKEYLNGHFE